MSIFKMAGIIAGCVIGGILSLAVFVRIAGDRFELQAKIINDTGEHLIIEKDWPDFERKYQLPPNEVVLPPHTAITRLVVFNPDATGERLDFSAYDVDTKRTVVMLYHVEGDVTEPIPLYISKGERITGKERLFYHDDIPANAP